jgi:nicotinamide phosphoribosyltransferase
MNPLFLIDFYKVGHVIQYPADTEQVWSNWTPRSSRIPNSTKIVNFGIQYFIKQILMKEWSEQFFGQKLDNILDEYRTVIRATLGVPEPKTDHIEFLHDLGYLPLNVFSLPEGFSVDLKIPVLVMTNTIRQAYWLPNYFESILSNLSWKASTSATTAKAYRQLFTNYARLAGETDFSFIDWMGHDFSFRGMSGREDAILSGMGHLLSFSGTDTLPAIIAAHDNYHAPYNIGGSVPATEHSVMCAGLEDGEFETFRRLIEDVYPTGILSIVSDTWDLWQVLTDFVPRLKDTILNRTGKIVIRPDSGDPVKIMTGDPNAPLGHPAREGVLRLLDKAVGHTLNPVGYKLLNKMGAIYGDSITLDRANAILNNAVNQGFSPYNCVFGIGSFTYEYVTRDTYGWAMKATAVRRDGKIFDIFKKPVTDDGGKNSLKGIPAVYRTEDSTEERPEFFVIDGQKPEALEKCAYQKVYSNGNLIIDETFETIRERARA